MVYTSQLSSEFKDYDPLINSVDEELEQRILGAILLAPELMDQVVDILPSEAFSDRHRIIYEIFIHIYNSGESIDLMSVYNFVCSHSPTEQKIKFLYSGEQTFKHYLADLIDIGMLFRSNIKEYAKLLLDKYIIKKTYQASLSIATNLKEGMRLDDALSLLDKAKNEITELERLAINKGGVTPAKKLLRLINEAEAVEDVVLRALKFKQIRKEFDFRSESEMFKLILEIKANKPVQRYTAKDFCNQKVVESHWLLEGFLKQGTLVELVAESKMGKSLMHYDLAYAVATGQDWGEFSIDHPMPVLLVQTDEPTLECQERLKNRGLNKLDNYHVINSFSINQTDILKRHIQETSAKLVVIDSLSSINNSMVSINDPQIGYHIHKIKNLAEETGACILLVHHCNKLPLAEGLNKVAGSAFIVSAASDIYVLDEPQDKTADRLERVLVVAGSRTHAKGTAWKFRLNTEDGSYDYLGRCTLTGADDQSLNASVDEVKGIKKAFLSLMKQYQGTSALTLDEISNLLNVPQNSSLRRIASDLHKQGLVNREKRTVISSKNGEQKSYQVYHYFIEQTEQVNKLSESVAVTELDACSYPDEQTEQVNKLSEQTLFTEQTEQVNKLFESVAVTGFDACSYPDEQTEQVNKLSESGPVDANGDALKIGDRIVDIEDQKFTGEITKIISIDHTRDKYNPGIEYKLSIRWDNGRTIDNYSPLFVIREF